MAPSRLSRAVLRGGATAFETGKGCFPGSVSVASLSTEDRLLFVPRQACSGMTAVGMAVASSKQEVRLLWDISGRRFAKSARFSADKRAVSTFGSPWI